MIEGMYSLFRGCWAQVSDKPYTPTWLPRSAPWFLVGNEGMRYPIYTLYGSI